MHPIKYNIRLVSYGISWYYIPVAIPYDINSFGKDISMNTVNIENKLHLSAPKISLNTNEMSLAEQVADWYIKTYITAFSSFKELDNDMYKMILNRVINKAYMYSKDEDISLEAAMCSLSSKFYNNGSERYYNYIHANVAEERVIMKACQESYERAFTYMMLLMGHRVVSFIHQCKAVNQYFMEIEDIFTEILIKLYNICCSYPLDKTEELSHNQKYLHTEFLHFYREQIAGKNDILCCSGTSRSRIDRVAAYVTSQADISGNTNLSKKDIKKATNARDSEIIAYYALHGKLSIDTTEGRIIASSVADESCTPEEYVCEVSSASCQVAEVLNMSEEEVNDILKALVKHIDEVQTTVTGRVRKLSNRSIQQFCKQENVSLTLVKNVLKEYTFAKTGQNIFFA